MKPKILLDPSGAKEPSFTDARVPGRPVPSATQTRLRPEKFAPAWAVLVLAALLGGVRLSQYVSIPWPRCGLLALTGIPCPLCGSTRCLAAWSRLDPAAAFAWNPLVAIACIGICAWGLLWLFDRCTGLDWANRLALRFVRKPWLLLAAFLVLANWVYLILHLPR